MGTYLKNLFQSHETSCNKHAAIVKQLKKVIARQRNITNFHTTPKQHRPLPLIIATPSYSNNFNAEVKHRLLAKEQMLH